MMLEGQNYFPPPHEIKPRINTYHPEWWHHHGIKMALRDKDPNTGTILIAGSAAEVRISPFQELPDQWRIDWLVEHSFIERVQGIVAMTDDDLQRAFGLRDDLGNNGKSIIQRFGGTTASHGTFIRYREFLNIPTPGTDHDGDPNVSVELDMKMAQAVKEIIGVKWSRLARV